MKLVRDGHPQAAIVYHDDDVFAAEELRKYIKQMSGAALPMSTKMPEEGQVVSIGRTAVLAQAGVDADSLPEQGYMVKTTGRALILCGADKFATLYSVYWFLDNRLGCGWCMPGDMGEVVPRSPDIEMSDIDVTRQPSLPVRSIYCNPPPGGSPADAVAMIDWSAKVGFNVAKFPKPEAFWQHNRELCVHEAKQKRGMQIAIGTHMFGRFLRANQHFEQHPEYFAVINGERVNRDGILCMSCPGVAKEFAKHVVEYLDDNPDIDIIGLGYPDGTGNHCECAQCLERNGLRFSPVRRKLWSTRTTTDAYADFCNRVADKVTQAHPKIRLAALFYVNTLEPPSAPDFRLHPRLDAVLALFNRYYDRSLNATLSVPEDYRRFASQPENLSNAEAHYTYYPQLLKRWREVASGPVYFHAYFMGHGQTSGLIFPIHDVINQDLRFYHDIGLNGFYTQGNLNNTGVYSLNFWIAARTAEDTSRNVDDLLPDYVTRFYTGAEAPMKTYFDLLARSKTRKTCLNTSPLAVLDLYDADTLARSRELLEAAASTVTDPGVLGRIALQKTTLIYVVRYGSFFTACFEAQEALGTEDRVLIGEALDRVGDELSALVSFIEEEMSKMPNFGCYDIQKRRKKLGNMKKSLYAAGPAVKPSRFLAPPEPQTTTSDTSMFAAPE